MSSSRNDRTKPLSAAVDTLTLAAEKSTRISYQPDLPEAFKVVTKCVPLGLEAVKSIQRGGNGFAKAAECQHLADQLNQLLEFVNSQWSSSDFFERYKVAARDLGSLESVMQSLLLLCIKHGEYNHDFRKLLGQAREEISQAPSSINEKAKPLTYTFNNKDHGIQPVHTGGGNINVNTADGPQITGNEAKVYLDHKGDKKRGKRDG